MSGRILLVDDNNFVARVVTIWLGKAGYDVDWVTSGEEALDRTENESYGLVLSDVMMPGMDGFALLAALKGNDATADVPVIVLSGFDRLEEQSRAKDLGAAAFVVKTKLNPDELTEVVRGALAKRLTSVGV